MTPAGEVVFALAVATACGAALIAVLFVRSWLRVRDMSAHLPIGFVCNEYSGAFDTGPGKCPFCSTELLQLRRRESRVSPRGHVFTHHTEFHGFACPRCLVAAKNDLEREKWAKLEDYCGGDRSDGASNARLAAEAQ